MSAPTKAAPFHAEQELPAHRLCVSALRESGSRATSSWDGASSVPLVVAYPLASSQSDDRAREQDVHVRLDHGLQSAVERQNTAARIYDDADPPLG